MTTTPPPARATDAATFMAELRRLKTWSGLSFRQLDRRAAAVGDTLPYSTASTMLGKDRLPREEVLVAFVKACGLEGDDLHAWRACYARIAQGGATESSTPAQDPSPAALPAALPPSLRLFRRFRRGSTLIAAAALAIAFIGGAGLAAGLGDTSETEVLIDADGVQQR
ncbi:helix-turn-helix domain-containing protein [Nonomuraea sp. NPDC050451]|uniref:helix-turn-helix domain-containing protein n=1 Tax=Nonomuraea sp. NPDC050451 TaxID=3364364 RepID=UPI0037875192